MAIFKRRWTFISLSVFVMSLLVTSFLSGPSAKAAPVPGDYFINVPSDETVFCFTSGFSVDYYVNAQLSYPSSYVYQLTLNGVSYPANSGSLSAPHIEHTLIHSINWSYFSPTPSFFQTGPFTVVAREIRKYTAGPNAGQVISDYTFTINCPTPDNDPFGVVGTWSVAPTSSTAANSACIFPDAGDNRLNPVCADAAQTAAFYCSNDGTTQALNVYSVWDGKGTLNFRVTQADLDKVPDKPITNTLIKAGKYVSLYRLNTGELQVNTYGGDRYIFPGVNGTPATIAQLCGSVGKSYYKINAVKQ